MQYNACMCIDQDVCWIFIYICSYITVFVHILIGSILCAPSKYPARGPTESGSETPHGVHSPSLVES